MKAKNYFRMRVGAFTPQGVIPNEKAMDISVHDNQIVSYAVYSQKREIRFQTIYNDREPFEYTDVIFSGVVIYHFECDNFNSIIYDIYETSLEEIYAQYETMFASLKNYGWMTIDYLNKKDLIQKMKNRQIKAFVIRSSNGLGGWIWAEEMIKEQRKHN